MTARAVAVALVLMAVLYGAAGAEPALRAGMLYLAIALLAELTARGVVAFTKRRRPQKPAGGDTGERAP